MSLKTLAFLLLALPRIAQGGEPSASHHIQDIPHITQGQAPFCAAAAALMGTARLGPVPTLVELVRTLPVSADGIPWLELTRALRPLGVEGLVVQLTVADLQPILAADIPVIVAVQAPTGRHAVLVAGFDATTFDIRDPALRTPVRWTHARLAEVWSEGQAVLLLPTAESTRLQKQFSAQSWTTQDARYRALEWARRAEALATPGPEMLTLYNRAVDAAPTLAPIRYNRGRLHLTLGMKAEGCADLRAAQAPGWPLPATAAAEAGCP
jgi:hypothetical protein